MTLKEWLDAYKDAACSTCTNLKNMQCQANMITFIEDKTPKSIFCAMWEGRKAA